MKQSKKDGYRTHHLSVRLTDSEYKKFEELVAKASNNSQTQIALSDFIRQQLLFENNEKKLNLIYFDLRKIKMEIHQALLRIEKFNDSESQKFFIQTLKQCTEKLEELNKNAEELLNGSDSIRKH